MFLMCILVTLVGGQAGNCVNIKKVTDAYDTSEGPHWDHRTQKLYFVDMYNQYIRRLDPATGIVTSAHIKNGTVGIVVPVDDSTDQLVVGVGKDLVLVIWEGDNDNSEVPVEILCSLEPDTRINDGKVDSSGRFWLGTMGNEVNGQVAANQGALYCIDDDLEPVKAISPVSISNGLAWNIEDDIFYYIDSPTRAVAAYNYDPNYGKISNKRIVFDLKKTNLKGVPNGMTIDTDGNLWIALCGGYYVIQVNPKTGEVLRKVKLPAEYITSVAFGGPLLDILYVTTASYNLTTEQQAVTPDAGALFAIEGLGVRGLFSNSFKMKD